VPVKNQTAHLNDIKGKIFAEITSIPDVLQGNRFRSLDGLRGVAILLVLLYHFGVNHFLRPFHLMIYGRIGVDIFFVISGFLITALLLKEKIITGKISLKRFYARRVLRIVPVVYLFLIVLMAICSICHFTISGSEFITAFLFLKNMPLKTGAYTGHLWSLAIEMQFYLAFPLLLAYNVEKYFITALSIVIVVPLLAMLGFYHAELLFDNTILLGVTRSAMYLFWNGPIMILIGSLVSILMFKGVITISSVNYYLSFVLLVLAIIIHTPAFLFYYKYVSEYLFAFIIAYVIILTLNTPDFLATVLNTGVLVRIGILSYSVYVWQQLFIGINNVQPWLHFLKDYPDSIVFILKFPVIFLIGTLSYYFFEKKFIILKQQFE
jgi:peptidoglycan/LPS O-acetylase OafA/YrhL